MTSMRQGRLITLEGGEGAGKSSHVGLVVKWLEARGREVVRTREPGGSPLAEAIRQIVLADWSEGIDAHTELLLMFAARSAHLANTIRPALAAGHDVVCDRFIDASWAYQGAGRGIEDHHLQALQTLVLGDLQPELTLVFDVEPAIGLRRARSRGETNRFESERGAFMDRVRQAYLQRANQSPDRCEIINASKSLEDVQLQVLHALEERLT